MSPRAPKTREPLPKPAEERSIEPKRRIELPELFDADIGRVAHDIVAETPPTVGCGVDEQQSDLAALGRLERAERAAQQRQRVDEHIGCEL